jgi:hypothetical protein
MRKGKARTVERSLGNTKYCIGPGDQVGEPLSREQDPADSCAENEAKQSFLFSRAQQITLKAALQRMKDFYPDNYSALKPYLDTIKSQGGIPHGWLKETADRLKIPQSTYRSQLRAAQRWLATQLSKGGCSNG